MAKYENLEIYKSAYDFVLELHKLYPNFNRKYKYSLCDKLINDATDVVVLIVEINNKREKEGEFEGLILKLERIQIQIRLLKSLNVIKTNTYLYLSKLLISIKKQLGGWKKYVHQNQVTVVA